MEIEWCQVAPIKTPQTLSPHQRSHSPLIQNPSKTSHFPSHNNRNYTPLIQKQAEHRPCQTQSKQRKEGRERERDGIHCLFPSPPCTLHCLQNPITAPCIQRQALPDSVQGPEAGGPWWRERRRRLPSIGSDGARRSRRHWHQGLSGRRRLRWSW